MVNDTPTLQKQIVTYVVYTLYMTLFVKSHKNFYTFTLGFKYLYCTHDDARTTETRSVQLITAYRLRWKEYMVLFV
jgi:hypothetical protein